ncbi:hypothetical protein FRB93_013334 [Tulasnella sp. JGI-2019a]|nr:hypothetical protein FRB93_013334 [Tulasnella sp. JGI-2019a]
MARGTIVPRPKRIQPGLKAFANFPNRLFNPPPAPCQVRSWKIAPDFRIELDDILANKHLPPMALKDFEEYLLFTEYTVENLYFMIWLKDYTTAYNANISKYAETPEEQAIAEGKLSLLFSRSFATFFQPSSNLALNLPHTLTSPFRDFAEHSSHPSPEALHDVHMYVKEMLRESLQRFVRNCYGNVEKNHAWLAYLGGGVLTMVMIAIAIVGIFRGWPRATRLASYPLMILGIAATLASSSGVCLCIFAFADSRQLRPFELAAPKIPDNVSEPQSPALDTQRRPRTTKEGSLKLAYDQSFSISPSMEGGSLPAMEYETDSIKKLTGDVGPSTCADNDQPNLPDKKLKYLYTASFIPPPTTSPPAASITTTAEPAAPTHNADMGSSFVFDFDALPAYYPTPSSHSPVYPPSFFRGSKSMKSSARTSTAGSEDSDTVFTESSPIFGELTMVSNPIIRRSQWEIFTRSFQYATLIATVIMAVLISVPFPPGVGSH